MSKNHGKIHPLPSDNNIAVPPPPRPRRPPATYCCCELSLCEAVILSLFAIITLLGVLLLFTGLILMMEETVSFHIVNASLTQFDLTNNNKLGYNLTLDIKATNPNGNYIGKIDYDEIEARASYQDSLFESMNLMPFHLDTKNRTTSLHVMFQGESLVPSLIGYSKPSDRFYSDKSRGNFDIEVELSLTITYHNQYYHPIFTTYLDIGKYSIYCDLRRLPLSNLSSTSINGSSSSSSFRTRKCEVTFETADDRSGFIH